MARDYAVQPVPPGSEPGWFQCDIPRAELKRYMRRDDGHALAQFGLWVVALAGSGGLAWWAWGTWWAIPAFFVYGTVYSSVDARWHECTHGTAFRTPWLNEAVHYIVSTMAFYEITFKRWSHARHHSYTIHVGKDPEIQVPRPAPVWTVLLDYLWLWSFYGNVKALLIHARGIATPQARAFVPASEHRKMFWISRLNLAIYGGFIAWALLAQSWLPLLFFGLPRLYGGWLHQLLALTQHAGMAEDAADHRLNTRTLHINPVFRFLYMNMNYHLEHHIYPTVPYHALPALHERLKAQMPPAFPSVVAAYRELVPTLLRQTRDSDHHVTPDLPAAVGTAGAA